MTVRFSADDVDDAARLIVDWMADAQRAVAFTGAGISTESGIPDFRSPGGVWATSQPVYFDDFMESADARYEYWRQKALAHSDFAGARPNVTHQMLAAWEQQGRLRGVITQNIDGLHQIAGCRGVLELHGTARDVACMDCRWRDGADTWVARFLETDSVPECPQCGGRLKHATVSFGQSLPTDVLRQAMQWAAESDVFLTLGSSLVVYPAAGLPQIAADHRSRVIILNREPTPLDDLAALVVHAPLGQLMSAIAAIDTA